MMALLLRNDLHIQANTFAYLPKHLWSATHRSYAFEISHCVVLRHRKKRMNRKAKKNQPNKKKQTI